MSELLPNMCEHSLKETHQSSTRRACCPTYFLSPSRSPARARAHHSIFDYEIGILHPEQAVVDIPWTYEGNEKEFSFAKKHCKEEKKEEDPMCIHHKQQIYKWGRQNSTARFMCAVFCNPLLSSRLALMGLLALLLILMTVFTWVLASTNVHESVDSIAQKLRAELLIHTEDRVSAVLQWSDASAISLAKFLGPILNENNLSSFSFIQDQVRPVLFLIFSVLSKRVRATFLGANGLFLSYFADSSGIYVSYANSSYLSPAPPGNLSEPFLWKEGENLTTTRPWYKWYYEKIDEDTGLSVGEATPIAPVPYWDLQPVKSALENENSSASWGPSAVDSNELSFLSPVQSIKKAPVGVVSISVSMLDIISAFQQLNLQGGALYLATSDGKLVAQSQSSLLSLEANDTSLLQLASESGNPIVAGAAAYLMPHIPSILAMTNQSFTASNVEIRGRHYMIDSAPLHLKGLTLVCTVILSHDNIWAMTEKRQHTTLSVLITLATFLGLVGCFVIILFTKGISNEMRLRAALIQQLEETKRAEGKSNHKSLVFANMSHDLRTPLAAILGLIDLCLCDASELSELESNLIQMKSCATDLLGILNSILDMSKIEAGKLLLQDSVFDLVSALEEVVDTFSVLGLKKGVEVVLDLSDDFIEKASFVIGDGGRVKQIIANLLSNGVKFTSEGHVVLRAWVEPFDINSARPHFSYWARFVAWPWNQILRSPSREKDLCKLIQGFSEQEHETSYLQVVFEVDDTGRGIPKERWKSVFENFVQVEPSGPRNYDGTGLGLGIVRSLVRLMGGDINIIDKDAPGEPGTRFRFNLVFKSGKQPAAKENEDGCPRGIQLQNAISFQDTFGVSHRMISPKWQLDSSSEAIPFPGALEVTGFCSPPIVEGVKVLLAMQGRAGRKVVKRWMERRGLQVYNVETWEEFGPAIECIKHDIFSESNNSSSGKLDSKSPETHIYDDPWVDELDVQQGATKPRDGTDNTTCLEDVRISYGDGSAQKMNLQAEQAHLLLIIDAAMAVVSISDFCSDIEDMLMDAESPATFKVVWLVNVNTPSTDIQYLRNQTKVCHLILHKPLYVSRLNRIWSLLHDLIANAGSSGAEPSHLSSGNCEKVDVNATNSLYNSLSCMSTFQEGASGLPSSLISKTSTKALVSGASSSTAPNSVVLAEADKQQHENPVQHISETEDMGTQPVVEPSCHRKTDNNDTSPRALDNLAASRDKSRLALSSMRILVAEDNPILQRLTKTQLTRLGASVECVDNGAEAARLVMENLYRNKPFLSHSSPAVDASHMFDLVLMDCEMPILNGYEATQRIRSDERRYGIRTPVVALTAHAMAQDEKKCIEAGMDFYLTKPLAIDGLLDVVTELQNRNSSEFT